MTYINIYIMCSRERVRVRQREKTERERELYVVLQNFFDLITIEFDVFFVS